AVPRDRAGSLAATIADFCNKIGTKRKLGDVRLESAKWAFGSRAARWRAERQKRRSSTKKDAPAGEGDVPGLSGRHSVGGRVRPTLTTYTCWLTGALHVAARWAAAIRLNENPARV